MKSSNILFIIGAVILVVFLIRDQVRHRNVVNEFCNQQCIYNPDQDKWDIDLKWVFDEQEVQSSMGAQKSFTGIDNTGCINYCRDLEVELKYLTQ